MMTKTMKFGKRKRTVMDNKNVTVGPGFLTLLGILFIGLKLTGYITWSWWLVLLPLYIVPAILITLLMGIGLFYLFVLVIEGLSK